MDARPALIPRPDKPSAAEVSQRSDAAAPTMDIGEFYRIVAGRVRLLAPCLAVAVAIGLGYVLMTPTRYAATMSILIDPREPVPLGLDAQPMPQNPDVALVESEMRILTSKAVLRKLVENQHLLDDPDYRPGAIAGLFSLFHFATPSVDARTEALVETLGRDISVKRSERNYIIDVEVRAGAPDKAEKVAKGLADAYFADQSEIANETVDKQTAWLDARLTDLRARVEAAERRAQDYRDAHSIVLSDGRISPEQQLKDANDALVAARGKRAEVAARYEQIKAAMAPGANAESIDDAIRSPVIEKLRADQSALSRDEAYERSVLGPRHPSYLTTRMQLSATQAQITAELKRIQSATERELKAAETAEKDAAKLVATLEASTQKFADSRVELSQLESDAATLRAEYEKLMTNRLNVRRDVVQSPHSVLVDPPVAGLARVSPHVSLALFLALAGGLNLWVISALIAEYRQRERDRSPAPQAPSPIDAERSAPDDGLWFELEAPPFSALKANAAPGPAALEAAMRDDNRYIEAMAGLRKRIAERFGAEGSAPVIAVAARARGDGASTVALSLAYAACASGDRVLLVDCDYRRPSLSALAQEMRKVIIDTPGQVAGILRRDEKSGGEALVLPFDQRGRRSLNSRLQAKFDLVLLDCGPLALAADLLGAEKTADAILVVDASGSDSSRLVAALERIGIADVGVGVVRTRRQRARKAA